MHSLLTILMKLCLFRGLAAAVKLAFASGDIDSVKHQARVSDSPSSAQGYPYSLEHFLLQRNGWLVFESDHHLNRKRLPYRKLRSIVLSNSTSAFNCHVEITGSPCRYLSLPSKGTDVDHSSGPSQIIVLWLLNGWLQEIGLHFRQFRPSPIMCYNRVA